MVSIPLIEGPVSAGRAMRMWCREVKVCRHGRACPGHPRLACCDAEGRKTWMPSTSSAKTRFALLAGHDEPRSRTIFDAGLTPDPNHLPISRRPVPPGGAYRDRHGRWVRDAVDAAASSRAAIAGRVFFRIRERAAGAWTNDAACGRQSRVVLAPVAGVKPAEVCLTRPGPTNRSIRR
jgi:hypothetical protein